MYVNIIYNYGAQVYMVAVGLITQPILLNALGAEMFAFVSILNTIQIFFGLLDGGISNILSKEFSVNQNDVAGKSYLNRLMRKFETYLFGLSLLGLFFVYLISKPISQHWLQLSNISSLDARKTVIVIGFIASTRLVSGLYRAVLIGFEKQKQLSWINVFVASVRYVLVIPFINIVFSAKGYFYYQVCVAFVELMLLKTVSSNLISSNESGVENRLVKDVEIKRIVAKSSEVWILSVGWVISTQIDRVLLSKKMSLVDYGSFSLVLTLVSGLTILSSPITTAALPKMAVSFMRGDSEGFIATYLKASVLLSIVAMPVCLTFLAASNPVLQLFTNDHNLANRYSLHLSLYTIGSTCLLLSGLTFLLRSAADGLRISMRQQFMYLIILLPTMYLSVDAWGAIGASVSWAVINVINLTTIISPLNSVGKISIHKTWLIQVVVKPFLIALPVLCVFWVFPVRVYGRLDALTTLGGIYTVFLGVIFASKYITFDKFVLKRAVALKLD